MKITKDDYFNNEFGEHVLMVIYHHHHVDFFKSDFY